MINYDLRRKQVLLLLDFALDVTWTELLYFTQSFFKVLLTEVLLISLIDLAYFLIPNQCSL